MCFIIRLIGIGSDQNIWHLSANRTSQLGIPSRDLNTSKLHPFIYQYSWQGGELYRQSREKSKLSHFLRVKSTATKVFWAEIKLGSFSLDLIESGHYYEDGPGIDQWEAVVRECDQWEGSTALTIVQNNEAWNVSSATSAGQLLSYPDRKDKGIVCFLLLRTKELIK